MFYIPTDEVKTHTFTDNGALQYTTSSSAVVDLFFAIGSSLKYSKTIGELFNKALKEDELLTMKILIWARSARNGAGRREIFHKIIAQGLASENANDWEKFIIHNASLIAREGYYKDLLNYFMIPEIVTTYAVALRDDDGLAAKWAPRKGEKANLLKKRLGLHAKSYRRLIVDLSNTVEQQMSANQWPEIAYKSVPGKALRKYVKAFKRHDEERLNAFYGDKSVKAAVSSTYPYDIFNLLEKGEEALANKQWESLDNVISANVNYLPVIDNSASMYTNTSPSPASVAVSLGIYCAEHNKGALNGSYVCFSKDAKFCKLRGDNFSSKVNNLQEDNPYVENTDFEKVYTNLLNFSKCFNIPQEQMPEMILVFSDMQFDPIDGYPCVSQVPHWDNLKKLYEESGYKLPKLVFWNLAGSFNGIPAPVGEHVVLASGFSPVLMKTILNLKDFNPINLVREAVDKFEVIL